MPRSSSRWLLIITERCVGICICLHNSFQGFSLYPTFPDCNTLTLHDHIYDVLLMISHSKHHIKTKYIQPHRHLSLLNPWQRWNFARISNNQESARINAFYYFKTSFQVCLHTTAPLYPGPGLLRTVWCHKGKIFFWIIQNICLQISDIVDICSIYLNLIILSLW